METGSPNFPQYPRKGVRPADCAVARGRCGLDGILKETMSVVRSAVFLAVMLMVLVDWSTALPADKERFLNEVDLVDDDGSIETALINYLFTKQIVKRLRNQLDIGDLQRKRSYWKQCAFNAVSCFGK